MGETIRQAKVKKFLFSDENLVSPDKVSPDKVVSIKAELLGH